jgi:hypothetical protein
MQHFVVDIDSQVIAGLGKVQATAGNRVTQPNETHGGWQETTVTPLEDARIWYLYLEDAESEAKDRMELWKTSLDSLLIFVSLASSVI